jgi:hypothetical protein
MIEILIAIIALTAFSCWVLHGSYSFFSQLVAPVFVFLGLFGLIAYTFICWDYFAAWHKAEIINREFGTSYTQIEVFYAESVIDTIQEIKRSRIEVNGDILNGE